MPRREMKAEADEYKSKGVMLRLQTVPAIAHLEDYVHIWLQCCKKIKGKKDYSTYSYSSTEKVSILILY